MPIPPPKLQDELTARLIKNVLKVEPNLANKTAAHAAINHLINEHMLKQPKLYEQLLTQLKTEEGSNTKNPALDRTLNNIFNNPNNTPQAISIDSGKLSFNANNNIKINAINENKGLLDNIQSGIDNLNSHSNLQKLTSNGEPIPKNTWISSSDQKIALEQLARENPEQGQALREVKVTSFNPTDKENPTGQTFVGKALAEIKHLDRDEANIILHHRAHAVQVNIKKDGDDINVTVTDSFASNPNDAERHQKLQEEFEKAYPGTKVTINPTNFTANQKDGFSCGYRALAATAERVGVNTGLATNLSNANKTQEESRADRDLMSDWTLKHAIGQTSQEYHQSLASDAVIHDPTAKPMSESTAKWIENFAKDSNVTNTNNRLIEIKHKTNPSSLLIRNHRITANNASTLNKSDKQALAQKMAKAYIAQKMGLQAGDKLPSSEALQKAGIKLPNVKGKDEALKSMIKEELSNLVMETPSNDNRHSMSNKR